MSKPHLLYGVLDWGLGHATRSSVVIKELRKSNFKVTIASSGLALKWLREEFPTHAFIDLSEKPIVYANRFFQLRLVKFALKRIREKRRIQNKIHDLHQQAPFSGVISDNHPFIHLNDVPSVYITHQLKVGSGLLGMLASRVQRNFIKKYSEIWIPDIAGTNSLSGKLSRGLPSNAKHIGWLSRFSSSSLSGDATLAVLSGPEPHRTQLEKELIQKFSGNPIVLVRGTLTPAKDEFPTNWKVHNLVSTKDLEKLFQNAGRLICRSGYSSLMDLIRLKKEAVLIPTPGQYEQEYLCQRMIEKGWFSGQLNDLQKKGGSKKPEFLAPDWTELFTLFKGE